MRRLTSAIAVGATVAASAIGLAACGSSNDDTSTSGSTGGKTGGTLKIASTLPDSYDPVMFQSNQANQVEQLVYTGLVTYAHESGPAGTKIIPGLAEALPTVSADKKTYKFKLRAGLKYSDGSPVKASDYENTIKRLLFLGGPFSSFSSGIKGAAEYQAAKKAQGDIPGITADDKTGEITIELTAPDSKFLYAIGLASSAPTPASKSPFKASTKIPGAGPYTLTIDNPVRHIVLKQTPGWNVPGIPKGSFSTIDVIKESVPKMTQDVIDNKIDFMTEDPAGDLLPQVRANYASRFRQDPNPPNTYWYFLNETTKPFDKLEVRQAVMYALDRTALQRVFGGRLSPSCNFLPPAYATTGYKKIDPCPYGDVTKKPTPENIAKAKDLVAKSGYKGMTVTVWGNNKDPRPAIVDVLRDTLNTIGFKAKTRILDQQVYFGTIGDAKTKAQAGFADWFQDFPHPGDFFEPNLSKKALASNPTFNFQFKSNPVLDKAIDELTPQDPASVADKWAAVDKSVIDNVNAAVYGNELSTSFFSERMNFQDCAGVHPLYKSDWLEFCLK